VGIQGRCCLLTVEKKGWNGSYGDDLDRVLDILKLRQWGVEGLRGFRF